MLLYFWKFIKTGTGVVTREGNGGCWGWEGTSFSCVVVSQEFVLCGYMQAFIQSLLHSSDQHLFSSARCACAGCWETAANEMTKPLNLQDFCCEGLWVIVVTQASTCESVSCYTGRRAGVNTRNEEELMQVGRHLLPEWWAETWQRRELRPWGLRGKKATGRGTLKGIVLQEEACVSVGEWSGLGWGTDKGQGQRGRPPVTQSFVLMGVRSQGNALRFPSAALTAWCRTNQCCSVVY